MDVTWTDLDEKQDESPGISPSTQERKERYAGFWVRFWAYVIDVVAIFSVKGILLSPLLFFNDGYPIEIALWTLSGVLATIIYYVYFFTMTKLFGQTIGKIVLGLRVVKEDESELLLTDLLFREVIGRMIYNIIGLLKILYVVIGFTPEKQGLHDILGKTRVIHIDDEIK